eukprot:CAMPEP_0206159250 /NCGR_PEP_ID=MMETSP1474-20131121/5635_1 /ASSEMBLY_ACC=CAM_ASM_001110 /TAXON_ID=97495 /ORGANISM="Imantonia sp., Strain RCC918" /LENGTH=123 /DNA_ID=CAMNT_0053559827 /DNA_START=733 /DNA_END=1100 /DNA_ORIENTATION=+
MEPSKPLWGSMRFNRRAKNGGGAAQDFGEDESFLHFVQPPLRAFSCWQSFRVSAMKLIENRATQLLLAVLLITYLVMVVVDIVIDEIFGCDRDELRLKNDVVLHLAHGRAHGTARRSDRRAPG